MVLRAEAAASPGLNGLPVDGCATTVGASDGSLPLRFLFPLLLLVVLAAPGGAPCAPDSFPAARPADPPDETGWIAGGCGLVGLFDNPHTPFGSLDVRFPKRLGKLHPLVFAARASDGSALFTAGVVLDHDFTPRTRVTFGFAPGFYDRNGGRDLGHKLQFMTFVELSYRLPRDHRISARFGHVSNAHLSDQNPGAELWSLGYAVPFR